MPRKKKVDPKMKALKDKINHQTAAHFYERIMYRMALIAGRRSGKVSG